MRRRVGKRTGLSEAWGEHLAGMRWDVWCTLTFEEHLSERAAIMAFNRLVRWLRKDNPGVGWFCAHEVGKQGRLHLHALIGGLGPGVSRLALWRWWYRRYGRAEFLPYDPERGAAYYISKYVSKDMSYYEIERPRCKAQLDLLAAQGPRPRPVRTWSPTE